MAQLAGTYSGMSADGNTIVMVVTESSGVFTATTTNVGFVASCNIPGNTVSEGWGFLLNQQFVSGAMSFTSHNDYYYIFGKAHFSATRSSKASSPVSQRPSRLETPRRSSRSSASHPTRPSR